MWLQLCWPNSPKCKTRCGKSACYHTMRCLESKRSPTICSFNMNKYHFKHSVCIRGKIWRERAVGLHSQQRGQYTGHQSERKPNITCCGGRGCQTEAGPTIQCLTLWDPGRQGRDRGSSHLFPGHLVALEDRVPLI